MNIILIDPEGIVSGLNTGLGYLTAVLKQKGHDVGVIDFNNKRGNEKQRLEAVKGADIAGISIKSFTLAHALKLGKIIKEINPNITLIAGGPHITIDGRAFMIENKEFDMAVVGEGEQTLLEIASKKPLEKINGILYRKGNDVIANERRQWANELDVLPFPNYDVFDSVDSEIDAYPLVTSRGCPYNCSYCSVGNVIGKVWRSRDAKNITEELETAKEKYGSSGFKVLDDNFTLSVERAKEICRMLIDKNIGMKWSCPNGIRADKLDNELLALMKQSGCYSISIGVETGDLDVFKAIDKGEKLEDIEKAVAMIKNAGIRAEGFFIIGLPGSTYEKDKVSIAFAKKLKLDSASFGILVPYPGTRVWDWVNDKKNNVRFLRDWKDGFHVGAKPTATFETDSYKAEEMVKLYYNANLHFMKLKNVPQVLKLALRKIFK
ncbi:MAG: radical SAM protein [Candidatus Aenigmatarchaeota archaeon]